MRLVRNIGTAFAIDGLGSNAPSRARLDSLSPGLSVFGLAELRRHFGRSLRARLLLPSAD